MTPPYGKGDSLNMTKLGIIGAMQVEVEILLGRMENKTERTVAGSEFYEGTLEELPVVVVQLSLIHI